MNYFSNFSQCQRTRGTLKKEEKAKAVSRKTADMSKLDYSKQVLHAKKKIIQCHWLINILGGKFKIFLLQKPLKRI